MIAPLNLVLFKLQIKYICILVCQHDIITGIAEGPLISTRFNVSTTNHSVSKTNDLVLWLDEYFINDDVMKWKHFLRHWLFGWGIHRSPVNSPHKGQWRGALMFSLICAWINGWVNNREAGDLRRHRAHYDVSVMRSILVHGLVGV